MTIGVKPETTAEMWALTYNAKTRNVKDLNEALDLLKRSEIDGVIVDSLVADKLTAENPSLVAAVTWGSSDVAMVATTQDLANRLTLAILAQQATEE